GYVSGKKRVVRRETEGEVLAEREIKSRIDPKPRHPVVENRPETNVTRFHEGPVNLARTRSVGSFGRGGRGHHNGPRNLETQFIDETRQGIIRGIDIQGLVISREGLGFPA